MKVFEVKTSNEIPPIENTNLKISQWYFAKIKTIRGEEKNGMACYDFTNKRWLFNMSGYVELIEYYIEKL